MNIKNLTYEKNKIVKLFNQKKYKKIANISQKIKLLLLDDIEIAKLIIASEIFLKSRPPLCIIKPGFRLICSNLSDISFYRIAVNINKITKTIKKKYKNDKIMYIIAEFSNRFYI